MPAAAENPNTATPPSVLSTLNEDGSRRWISPRPSPGRWLSARRAVAYLLIAVFTLIPYIRVGDKPLVLLDLATRHFTILGYTFLPTDTLLLALFGVGVFITIFLTTALLGRVWCGWMCPQTVYMEFLFRPIERLLEGTPGRKNQGTFKGSPLAKTIKFGIYFFVSCFLAHTFLAYFVGVDRLREWVTRSPFEHPASFLIMASVTALMLFDFGFFREQTCIVACPYGRFQSVMLDRQSLIVSYDRVRGEPRRGTKRDLALTVLPADTRAEGDCVSCNMCVTTCPTGIDIRNGLQMECIHCAQCIDACDAVMAKLKRPLGLIRYASQAALAGEGRKRIRARTVIYTLVLAIVAAAFGLVLGLKGPVDVTVLRSRGAPFVETDDHLIGNNVKVKLVNRLDAAAEYSLAVAGAQGVTLRSQENPVRLAPGETKTVPAMIVAPRSAFAGGGIDVRVTVAKGAEELDSEPFRLVGPGGPARTPDHTTDDHKPGDDHTPDAKEEHRDH